MKGILQTAILCYTWVPLQRRLLAIGAVLILAGHLGLLLLGTTGGLAFLLLLCVLLSSSFIGVSMVVSTGVMWRSVSAPRTLALLPYARVKLLLGVLVAMLGFAALLTASFALFRLEAPPTPALQPSLLGMFVYLLGIATAVTLFFFLLTGTYYVAVVAIVVCGIAGRLPVISGMAAWVGTIPLLATATVLAWVAFAGWYLRVRRVAPTGWYGWSGRPARNSPNLPTRVSQIDTSRESAVTVQLLGLTSLSRLMRQGWLIALVAAVLLLLQGAPGRPRAVSAALFLIFLLVSIGMFPLGVSRIVASRSRTLWLTGGCSRERLFLLCESWTWRCLGASAGPVAAVLIAAWVFLPHPIRNWGYFLLTALASAVFVLYLGLMDVTGRGLSKLSVEVLAMFACWAPVVLSSILTATVTPAMQLSPVAQLIGAVVLRWVGKNHWRRIDWVMNKPLRLSSQALRPVL